MALFWVIIIKWHGFDSHHNQMALSLSLHDQMTWFKSSWSNGIVWVLQIKWLDFENCHNQMLWFWWETYERSLHNQITLFWILISKCHGLEYSWSNVLLLRVFISKFRFAQSIHTSKIDTMAAAFSNYLKYFKWPRQNHMFDGIETWWDSLSQPEDAELSYKLLLCEKTWFPTWACSNLPSQLQRLPIKLKSG